MISKVKLRNFLQKRCESITGCLNRFCENFDHEEIHRLRVEFKKLRALVSLVKECGNNSFIPREFAAAKVVYKRAGTVRDAYISHQHHIAMHGKADRHTAEFLELAAKNFCAKKELHTVVIADWQSLAMDQFNNISNRCAEVYYRKLLDKLEESFISIHEEDLHEDRKIIKRLLYLYPLLPDAAKDKLKLNISYFDSLQEEIGKWHDTLVARGHYASLGESHIRQVEHLTEEGSSRLNSIRLLTANFAEKYHQQAG